MANINLVSMSLLLRLAFTSSLLSAGLYDTGSRVLDKSFSLVSLNFLSVDSSPLDLVNIAELSRILLSLLLLVDGNDGEWPLLSIPLLE